MQQNEGPDGEPRFTMLETLREYALERLAERGEAETVRQTHAAYYLTLAEAEGPKWRTPLQGSARRRLEVEHDNLRAALAWSQTVADGGELSLRLAGSLGWFWFRRGYAREGRAWLEGALARSGGERARQPRAKAVWGAGELAYAQGDYAAAQAWFEESLRLYRELGDPEGLVLGLNSFGLVALYGPQDYQRAVALLEEGLTMARALGETFYTVWSLNFLGSAARAQGDAERAEGLLQQSLALAQKLGDNDAIGFAYQGLGEVAYDQGEYAAARDWYEQSLACLRELENQASNAGVLHDLGQVMREQGEYGRAAALLAESLRLFQDWGDRGGVAATLGSVARLATRQGHLIVAARLFGAAEAQREAVGKRLPAVEGMAYERDVATARGQLDEGAFASAWAEGQAMTLEQAIAAALQQTPASHQPLIAPTPAVLSPPTPTYPAGLTAREVEVLRLVAEGLTDAQVAERLVLSTRTVNKHLQSIYSKLGITSRSAATRFAVDHSLT